MIVIAAAETVANTIKTVADTMRAVVNTIETDSVKRIMMMKMIANETESSANMIEMMKMLMKVNQFVMMSETHDMNEVRHVI